jgi:hypothetical protein
MSTRQIIYDEPNNPDEDGPILFDSFGCEQYVSLTEAERLYWELGTAIIVARNKADEKATQEFEARLEQEAKRWAK